MANKASRIVEKHLRLHRVNRASELPEEGKVRLYRDLRLFFESGGQPPSSGQDGNWSYVRRLLSRAWERVENFLSFSDVARTSSPITILAVLAYGDSMRLAILPWISGPKTCDEINF
jgi:hypothetical protein